MRLNAVPAHLLGLPRCIELELALELIDRALQQDSGTTAHHPD